MHYNESGGFGIENRNKLLLDFYDFYYFISEVQLKRKIISEILVSGYELFLSQILTAIDLIMDENNGLTKEEDSLDVMDYTTTLYGVLIVVVEDFERDEHYALWVEGFKHTISKFKDEELEYSIH